MSIISENLDLLDRLIHQLRAEEADVDEVRLCLWSAAEVVAQRELYDDAVVSESPFSSQFRSTLQEALLTREYFAMLETLILFCREKVLRRPELQESAMESALFSYFLHSGEWTFADGTLLVDWYYVRLPTLVLAR